MTGITQGNQEPNKKQARFGCKLLAEILSSVTANEENFSKNSTDTCSEHCLDQVPTDTAHTRSRSMFLSLIHAAYEMNKAYKSIK